MCTRIKPRKYYPVTRHGEIGRAQSIEFDWYNRAKEQRRSVGEAIREYK
jgi:hypothetical protein